MKEERFPIRCYGKTELATYYFPASERETALKRLRRWIYRCTPLWRELVQVNYLPRTKNFTALEVSLIIKHLGDPY